MIALFEIINLIKKHQTMDFDKLSLVHPKARGIPVPKKEQCSSCGACEEFCPTKAIQVVSKTEIWFDYGACLQCGLCVEVCEDEALDNSGLNHVYSTDREELKIQYIHGTFEPKEFLPTETVNQFRKLTKKRGFNYREVAASGNNGVECELSASFNNVFDSEGQMVKSVASPKHADAIVYSGPVGKDMEVPLQVAWNCMPEPKALIATGTEAISGGVFLQGRRPTTPDLYIAGDPPKPDVMLSAFRYLMGQYVYSFQKVLKEVLNRLNAFQVKVE
jgi:Ni,Fe-hydrogenase III small subunit/Pyruvate/2-oxoacid:ferredoxin oxidoreductase delta subunit